ncbi:MAG: hypothetical protein FWE91_06345 [Defluviitaleaceae bacterium]|nr:hypothetical protein [Defluviitaleaceae bacterium]MCL2836305.1 hypothetical protein [Defluviitaleaceae bacterium]
MFISKNRIEEDLKIIRRSFLNPAALEKDTEEKIIQAEDSQDRLGFSEFIGLCGAAFFVILPWALAFSVLIGLLGWLLTLWVK